MAPLGGLVQAMDYLRYKYLHSVIGQLQLNDFLPSPCRKFSPQKLHTLLDQQLMNKDILLLMMTAESDS